MARRVLLDSPEFTGACFGCMTNADELARRRKEAAEGVRKHAAQLGARTVELDKLESRTSIVIALD